MKKRETLGVKVIKHFYGIHGVLDEYKRQEVNRIGNNAFLWLWWYLLLSNFIALLFANKNYELTLTIYLGCNVIMSGFIITGYTTLASHKKHLTDNEVAVKQLATTKRKVLRKAVLLGLYFTVVIHLGNGIIDYFFDGTNFYIEITSWVNIERSTLSGIIFGGLMYCFELIRIKKIDK
jgi:succinate dehydrogenase/fumarate reductase cytochrome b subunit